MTNLEKLIQGKYFWILAFVLHLLVLFVLFSKFGINTSNEGDKYISIARQLNADNFSDSFRYLWFYSTYILFLTACFKIGLSIYAILFIQYVFSLFGFYYFYKLISKQLLLSEFYARLCILLIATCPIILYWQLTFYTESFFLALVMMTTYLTISASNKKQYLIAALFALALLFCRAVGIFYVIALVFVLMRANKMKYSLLFLWSTFVLVFIGVLFFVPLHFKYFALPVYQGSIICGFPLYPNNFLLEGNYTLAEVYAAFLQENSFSTLLNLFFKKATSFFTLTRPYYSLSHNILNASYYVFIVGGLFGTYKLIKNKVNSLFVIYFVSILLSSLVIVILIYNEWSERFLVPLLPFFILITLMSFSKQKSAI
ncbi:MAG: glycosyltransferase family 39 protein [Bacteroidia bacterium]|nr:glycosyltransferase family 39 protein [Bacteroidia bacterium]